MGCTIESCSAFTLNHHFKPIKRRHVEGEDRWRQDLVGRSGFVANQPQPLLSGCHVDPHIETDRVPER